MLASNLLEKELKDIEANLKKDPLSLPQILVNNVSKLSSYVSHIGHTKLSDTINRLDQVNNQFEVHKQQEEFLVQISTKIEIQDKFNLELNSSLHSLALEAKLTTN